MFNIVLGVALAVGAYLAYIAVTKGVPAAWAKVKGWATSTKTTLTSLDARVSALEGKTPAAPAPAPTPPAA